MRYLFIGGPFHNTHQEIAEGHLTYNMAERQVFDCTSSKPTEYKPMQISTYRRVGLFEMGEFIGYVFGEEHLTDNEVCDLYLELRRG